MRGRKSTGIWKQNVCTVYGDIWQRLAGLREKYNVSGIWILLSSISLEKILLSSVAISGHIGLTVCTFKSKVVSTSGSVHVAPGAGNRKHVNTFSRM